MNANPMHIQILNNSIDHENEKIRLANHLKKKYRANLNMSGIVQCDAIIEKSLNTIASLQLQLDNFSK